MPQVILYTGRFCPYCTMAKRLLANLGVTEIEEIRVDTNPEAFAKMQESTGQRTIPQIFINGTHVGGYTDLAALHQQGKLRDLLDNHA